MNQNDEGPPYHAFTFREINIDAKECVNMDCDDLDIGIIKRTKYAIQLIRSLHKTQNKHYVLDEVLEDTTWKDRVAPQRITTNRGRRPELLALTAAYLDSVPVYHSVSRDANYSFCCNETRSSIRRSSCRKESLAVPLKLSLDVLNE